MGKCACADPTRTTAHCAFVPRRQRLHFPEGVGALEPLSPADPKGRVAQPSGKCSSGARNDALWLSSTYYHLLLWQYLVRTCACTRVCTCLGSVCLISYAVPSAGSSGGVGSSAASWASPRPSSASTSPGGVKWFTTHIHLCRKDSGLWT